MSDSKSARQAHAELLLSYLRRTKGVKGPGRDLIYLEGPGAAFGLDSILAQRIEDAAVDGDSKTVSELMSRGELGERVTTAYFLARVAVEGLGIEARNTVKCLLHALPLLEDAPHSVATDLLEVIDAQNLLQEVDAEDLTGLVLLTAAAEGKAAEGIARSIPARDELHQNPEAITQYLKNLRRFTVVNPQGSGRMLGKRIALTGFEELQAIEPQEDLPKAFLSGIHTSLDARYKALSGEEAKAAASNAEKTELEAFFLGIAKASEGLATVLPDASQSLLQFLLEVDTADARQVIQDELLDSPWIPKPEIAPLFIEQAENRVTKLWPQWLAALPARFAEEEPQVAQGLEDMLATSARRRFLLDKPDASADQAAALASIKRVTGDFAVSSPRVASVLSDSLAVELSPSGISDHSERTDFIEHLVEENLHDPALSAPAVLRCVAITVASTTQQESVLQYVAGLGATWIAYAAQGEVAELTEIVHSSTVLDNFQKSALNLALAVRAREVGLDEPTVLASEVGQLLSDPLHAAPSARKWLHNLRPSPNDAWVGLSKMPQRPTADLAEVVKSWSAQLAEQERAELFKLALPGFVAEEVGEEFLRVIRVSEIPPSTLADLLLAAYKNAQTIGAKSRVLIAWEISSITEETQRRRLIKQLYVDFVGRGSTALDFALSHFGLVHGVGGIRRAVLDAVTAAVRQHPRLGNKAERVLRDAGWIRKKRRFFVLSEVEEVPESSSDEEDGSEDDSEENDV